MIDFTTAKPLKEAVDSLGKRSPLGLALSSKEIEGLPVELRQRSIFAARVESERILAEVKRRIMQRVKLERDKVEAGGRVMERGRFIQEMQGLLEEMGYRPDPGKEGSLQDLSSAGRLGLIWQMQLDMAHGHAKWKTAMNPDILEAFPAQELVRDFARVERRDWPQIWKDNGGVFYGEPGPDYPGAPGRMIALMTDPIWAKISRFGVPWPPFDWGSGMGLRKVRRRDAEKLGLLDPEDVMIPAESPTKPNREWTVAETDRGEAWQALMDKPFNDGMQASAAGLEPAQIQRTLDAFPDQVTHDPQANVFLWSALARREREEERERARFAAEEDGKEEDDA